MLLDGHTAYIGNSLCKLRHYITGLSPLMLNLAAVVLVAQSGHKSELLNHIGLATICVLGMSIFSYKKCRQRDKNVIFMQQA